jgi:hypothetical protein
MRKTFLFLSFFLVLISSCTKDEVKVDPDNPLIGIWNYSGFQDNIYIFSRDDRFTDNHGYRFNPDGTLTERKNSGWCGTPPISYADYKGSWAMLNDTLIQIDVGYWGGTTVYRLDVEQIDSNSLRAILLYEN